MEDVSGETKLCGYVKHLQVLGVSATRYLEYKNE